jgi:hypothetical protein
MNFIPLSLIMVVFASSFCTNKRCHIRPEEVERVFIKVTGGNSEVFINNQSFTCYCGDPGESVHIYPDQVMVCCEHHRPTCKI